MNPHLAIVVTAALFASAGVGAGAAARVLLGRLGRGARVRAPCCEVAVGVLWCATGAGHALGALPGAWVPVLLGLGWLGVAAGAVDVVHRRLPDALTLPALPVALVLVVPLGHGAVLRAAVGAAVAAAVHAAVHLLAPAAMGAGDVKLAAPLGAVLAAAAWPAVALAAVLAVALSAAVGAVGLLTRRAARASPLPHGPSMLVAAWLVLAGAAAAGGGG
ncbi:prepilin peptidase [Pseudonocardia nigra]|uniref:prepilin peptidase n=1 Tax=Pseudonocardia nigra TaxID=1921578 RepID=UPI001C5F915B|nr:prepilin peptidase [Pseudonocardia nigra]